MSYTIERYPTRWIDVWHLPGGQRAGFPGGLPAGLPALPGAKLLQPLARRLGLGLGFAVGLGRPAAGLRLLTQRAFFHTGGFSRPA